MSLVIRGGRKWREIILVLLLAVLAATNFVASFAEAALSIDNSARFNDDDSAYLSRTPSGAGNRRTWTWSAWVKRSAIGTSQGPLFSQGSDANNYGSIWFYNDKIAYMSASGGSFNISVQSNALFRDPAEWDHVMVSTDTTQGTASDRITIYVNGVRVASLAAATYPSQNYDTYFSSTGAHYIGRESFNGSYFDGYMSDVYFIDGQALAANNFGEYDDNGYWRPKAYTGTYGTNGFHLNFSNSAALGTDSSGNGNNFTVNGAAATDQMIDTPTNGFAVPNPLDVSNNTGSGNVFSNGNLTVTTGATGARHYTPTFGAATGQWYAEATVDAVGTGGSHTDYVSITIPGTGGAVYAAYDKSGDHYSSGAWTAGWATFAAGDVIGVAFDATAASVSFYKNGTLQGTLTAIGGGGQVRGMGVYPQAGAGFTFNFGQGGQSGLTYDSASGGYFKYTPPSGYKALSTTNLPAPAIAVPKNYFDVTTYTGQGADHAVTPFSFQPNMVWVKARSQAYNNAIGDGVRSNGYLLYTNSTAAETFNPSLYNIGPVGGINGFRVQPYSYEADWSGVTYVAWAWKESTTSGFDIVTWTGDGTSARQISHGLGVRPAMIIHKARGDGTYAWNSWHQSLSSGYYIQLNSTSAADNSVDVWPSAGITTTYITTTSAATKYNNLSGIGHVAYVFAEVSGFSKFGSYTGNGSADGPFIYTGFKPRYILFKRTSTAGADWSIRDTARDTYNPSTATLYADLANADSAASNIDILSNGFKVRGTGIDYNSSGDTFIYAAFAEIPFKYSAAPNSSSAGLTLTKSASFSQDVYVSGAVSKGSGSFVIDHPLDPKNKLLYHSFVESPDVKNIYDGIATFDIRGRATIELPRYFIALNKGYRYLLTPIGSGMTDLYIAKEVRRRYFFGLFGPPVFRIAGGKPGGRISWQVTGVRKDPLIVAHPILVEVEKGPEQLVGKGEYLHADAYENK